MSKINHYCQILTTTPVSNWDWFLRQESGLPGPRANLELAQAVADTGTAALFERYLTFGPEQAPTNSPDVFLAVCGVVGLGRLLAQRQMEKLAVLRQLAADPRWRIREAVCMALQRWGYVDMPALVAAMHTWSRGSLLEQRAAAAALCEPALLTYPAHTRQVLGILDEITTRLGATKNRKTDEFKTLRKGMAYCWSVAVAALPDEGCTMMQKWFASPDKDIRWLMKENLKKKRLARLDPTWLAQARQQLAG
jgi:hypothetical protein